MSPKILNTTRMIASLMATYSLPLPPFVSPSRLPSHTWKPLQADRNLFPLFSISGPSRSQSSLHASRKYPNNSQEEAVVVAPHPRTWLFDLDSAVNDDDIEDEDDDEEEEEEDDRSLDLFARFLHEIFRKISRRSRKAVRSVLPPSISTKLVRFTVDGVLMLAFLSILKALVEVVCTVGSMVFVSILLVRGIWGGVSYIKENQFHYMNKMDDTNNNYVWNGAQPVA